MVGIPYHKIVEKRGTVLFQTMVCELKAGGVHFMLVFQFQGRTHKVNLASKDYAQSKASQFPVDFQAVFRETFHHWNGYSRYNPPRRKAYISVSKSLQKERCQMPVDDISGLHKKEFKKALEKSSAFQQALTN